MTMTIEQAITELEEIRDFEVTYCGYMDALNIAIDALKEKIAPASEPEEQTDEVADTNSDEAADCVTTNCTSECPRGGYEEDGKTVCEKYAEKSDRIMELHESAEVQDG